MIIFQGLWHVICLWLFPHSFAHIITHRLAKVSKQPNFITISSDQTSTAVRCQTWLLQILLETASVFDCGWSRSQHQIRAGFSKFQARFKFLPSSVFAQEEKCSSDRERKTDWSKEVESTVIPCTQIYTKLGGLEPACSQPQLRRGWRAWRKLGTLEKTCIYLIQEMRYGNIQASPQQPSSEARNTKLCLKLSAGPPFL